MEELLQRYQRDNFLHHAYIVVGEAEKLLPELVGVIEAILGHSVQGYPDYNYYAFDVFGIEESRRLRESQGRCALGGGKKFFVISFKLITREAQNALLKTFEDPTPQTYFFLLVQSEKFFLATLLSRVLVIKNLAGPDGQEELAILARRFLAASPTVRLEMVKEIAGPDHPDRSRTLAFLNHLEFSFRQDHSPTTANHSTLLAFEELASGRRYLHDPASLARLILEHLALIIPPAAV